MNVFLTGGSGFVGSHLLERLQRAGHIVRVLARDGSKVAQPPGPQMEIVPGDVAENIGLDYGVAGADAVIHLVGIITETGGATFQKVHHQGTRNVVAAARRAGVKRFVQMSAVGARANGVSGYQTSKWRAEEEVRNSGMEHVILRPSIIFGPRDGFVTQMVQVMKAAPGFRPVVGHGRYPFRPIYIADVVECFVQALTSTKAAGRTIALVGPEELTLEQMLAAIAECVGVRKPAVHIPFPLMYLNAAVLGKVLRRPPVTTDQLRMLREGSTADPGPMREIFQVNPVGFREGLNKYLCQAAAG
jgi:NADH dehydrogenase